MTTAAHERQERRASGRHVATRRAPAGPALGGRSDDAVPERTVTERTAAESRAVDGSDAGGPGTDLRVAAVRRVRRATRRLRVVGGSGRLHWWHRRLALGLTLAGAMAGALLGVYLGFLDNGIAPVALLESYGATAGLGASLGLVLGLLMGLLLGLLDRYVLPQSVRARPVWVRYRRSRQPV